MTVLAAIKSPGTALETEDCARITNSVKGNALSRLVQNRYERIALVAGIPAVVVKLDDDMLILALDREQCQDAAGAPRAHEYEAIGRWFLDQAEEQRNRSTKRNRSRLRPKK